MNWQPLEQILVDGLHESLAADAQSLNARAHELEQERAKIDQALCEIQQADPLVTDPGILDRAVGVRKLAFACLQTEAKLRGDLLAFCQRVKHSRGADQAEADQRVRNELTLARESLRDIGFGHALDMLNKGNPSHETQMPAWQFIELADGVRAAVEKAEGLRKNGDPQPGLALRSQRSLEAVKAELTSMMHLPVAGIEPKERS